MPRIFDNIDQQLLTAQKEVDRNGDITIEKQFFPSLSKAIISDIDRSLVKHYGFTDDELEFIINCDIKYRMGRDNQED